MGIRQYFLRVTPSELEALHDCQDTDEANRFLDDLSNQGDYFFWPLSEDVESFASFRKLTIEKSYWGILNSVLALSVEGSLEPTWDTVEGGTAIRDFWIGYGPLRYVSGQQLQKLRTTLESITQEGIRQRVYILGQRWECPEDRIEDEIYNPVLDCHKVVTSFVQFVAEQHEALVWYIG
jgi:hypothetical protein